MSNHSEHTHQAKKNAVREGLVAREMLPFAIYAAIPIMITIFIAYYFGSR